MSATPIKTLELTTRAQWHKWLEVHHHDEPGIWLVFFKNHTSKKSIDYEDAVEEALCFGWIDSLVKSIDDDRYARKFTPRKPGSRWSSINRRRYAKLKKLGLLTKAGLERPPTTRSGDAPRPAAVRELPSYFSDALKQNRKALEYFEQLAPSYRRAYIGWIISAKREETRAKRLAEAIALLESGQKLGLK